MSGFRRLLTFPCASGRMDALAPFANSPPRACNAECHVTFTLGGIADVRALMFFAAHPFFRRIKPVLFLGSSSCSLSCTFRQSLLSLRTCGRSRVRRVASFSTRRFSPEQALTGRFHFFNTAAMRFGDVSHYFTWIARPVPGNVIPDRTGPSGDGTGPTDDYDIARNFNVCGDVVRLLPAPKDASWSAPYCKISGPCAHADKVPK